MGRARQVIFRIFYSTTFTAVFILTIATTVVTTADAIYESYRRSRLLDIFIITGAYVLTALIAMLVYASRLYTNRSVLKDIPKTFMPIEREDLPTRRVHRLIDDCMIKTSVVAYTSRPRSRLVEDESPMVKSRMLDVIKPDAGPGERIQHHWGTIAHRGWSSPASIDLPDLEYATIISELPSLIEAKAVSLAPVDPLSTLGEAGLPMPDANVIAALTRPSAMGMRSYFAQLVSYGVIQDNNTSATFLARYERARFSPLPLSAEDFQRLMKLFAELLRSMTEVDPDLLDLGDLNDSEDGAAARAHTQGSASSSVSDNGSVRHKAPMSSGFAQQGRPRRVSEDSVPSHSTESGTDTHSLRKRKALATTRSLSRPGGESRDHSSGSGRQSPRRLRTSSSIASARSGTSNGSIIHLNVEHEHADGRNGLPYTIEIPS